MRPHYHSNGNLISVNGTVVLVPRRPDGGRRDQLWNYTRALWAEHGPIFEGNHLEGPFNRSAAVNLAARLAGDWETAIVIDSDVIVDQHNVRQAVELATRTQRMVYPFRLYRALNAGGSDAIMAGFKGNWMPHVKATFRDNRSACFVIPRLAWNDVGGFDERFQGWGWEDVAFYHAVSHASAAPLRLTGDLWHLWHHRSPENNHQSPLCIANRDLCHRYIEARSVEETRAILSEPGGPLS